MLIADSITAGYGPQPVIRGVDLRISPGEIVGITGDSGSGKTTLARTMAGLLTPTSGTVTIDGQTPRQARGTVAMVFQSPVPQPIPTSPSPRSSPSPPASAASQSPISRH